ncbi:MAG: Gfo/Idh/MocA family oxidoreductase [Gammaproteobacteria bacterium]|nr:Gfo/Idh/MocA family oxidoreductase [Gammaproteobacteria bacterium]MCZ6497113.1 Gfo/Idh/MocA family oxidoreductase [Gammaproteobacteria bacterium]
MTGIRVAVVGAGYLGRFHAQKFASIAAADLVGICDIRAEAGEVLARACDTVYYADYRDLAGKVDAVTIAASTSAHYELAKFFLENGIHVLVEKPMTNTSEQGRELTVLADTHDLKLQVGHVERFNSALLSARDRLGAVQFIECHRLAPFKSRGADVDVVLDLMIHDLDVIISMVAAAPSLVSAVGISVLTSSVDIANARIEFDTGAIANVTASRVSTTTQRKFRVFQKHQYLSIDFGAGEVRLVTYTGTAGDEQPTLKEESWNLDKGDALAAEIASFVSSIVDDKPCEVSGRDGVAALELAEEITADIERRKF